jgi:hypothetical protein
MIHAAGGALCTPLWFLAFLPEHRVEFGSRAGGGRKWPRRGMARREILAEVRAILINDPLRLVLAALIVVGGIVKITVEANVCWTVAG